MCSAVNISSQRKGNTRADYLLRSWQYLIWSRRPCFATSTGPYTQQINPVHTFIPHVLKSSLLSNGHQGLSPRGLKRLRREANHLYTSSVEVTNAWSYISTPQYAFMAWCSAKEQGQLYLTLPYLTLPFWYYRSIYIPCDTRLFLSIKFFCVLPIALMRATHPVHLILL
jgi:hypothetical protein